MSKDQKGRLRQSTNSLAPLPRMQDGHRKRHEMIFFSSKLDSRSPGSYLLQYILDVTEYVSQALLPQVRTFLSWLCHDVTDSFWRRDSFDWAWIRIPAGDPAEPRRPVFTDKRWASNHRWPAGAARGRKTPGRRARASLTGRLRRSLAAIGQ